MEAEKEKREKKKREKKTHNTLMILGRIFDNFVGVVKLLCNFFFFFL